MTTWGEGTKGRRRRPHSATERDNPDADRGVVRAAGRRPPIDRADLGRIRADLRLLRRTVENDHDHRLRRIETDLRWVIVLLGGQIVALVGAAVSGVIGA